MNEENKVVVQVGTETDAQYDWEVNHSLITEAFYKLYSVANKVPTQYQLAEETGLHRNTIQRHLKELSLEKIKPRLRLMTEKIMAKVGHVGMTEGKAPEAKLFLQIVEGYKESNETIIKLEESEIVNAIEKRLGLK